MTAPQPVRRTSRLLPYGRNKDKIESHPLARKEDRLRTLGTGSDESFPELFVRGYPPDYGDYTEKEDNVNDIPTTRKPTGL